MRRPRPLTLLMLLFPALWAGSFVAGKWALRDFSPEVTSFLRFAIASVALFPFAFRKPAAPGAWRPRTMAVVLLLGLTGMFAYHVLFYYSLKYTSAGNSSLIIATDSLWTILLAVLFLGERMSWRKGLGIALGFVGVVWVVSDGALPSLLAHGPNTGDVLALGAALSWGVYSVLSKPVAHLFPAFDLSWLTYVVGMAVLSPWLMAPGAVASLSRATPAAWVSVGYMALAATGVGYFLYLKGIHELGAAATAKYIFLVPVYVLALAWAFLGEPVPAHKIAAAGLIIGGLWLAEEPEAEAGGAGGGT